MPEDMGQGNRGERQHRRLQHLHAAVRERDPIRRAQEPPGIDAAPLRPVHRLLLDQLCCSNPIYKNWTTDTANVSMIPIYKELIGAGLRVWVFSGDTDTAVPLSSTRRSLAAMGLPVKTSWYPWYIVPTEVGGWSMEYEGLTYVTVRGAGHEVPLHRPEQALVLLKQFLLGEPMPAEAENASVIRLPSEKAPFY